MRGYMLAILVVSLVGCTSSTPERSNDLCAVFKEKRGWYRAALRAEKRWEISIPVAMAFIYQESGFRAFAKPPRKKLFGFIPWKRPSSSLGFSQATKPAWEDYLKATDQKYTSRVNFRDSIDFVGWYNHLSSGELEITRADAFHLYLAYHEGRTGYKRRGWTQKEPLKNIARKVASRADKYAEQFGSCRKKLRKGPWWWPFA